MDSPSAQPPAPVPPNILLIVTDQQRFDALGTTGDWARTPHLDSLASSGARWTRMLTNSPACVPARIALATGRHPHQTGVWNNQQVTLEPQPTWMRAVHEAGYATSVFGKTHLHPHRGDLREREDLMRGHGFEVVDEVAGPKALLVSSCRLTDLWSEAGVLDTYRRDIRRRLKERVQARPSPLPLELYPDVYIASRAREHLRAYDGDRPWFCWVGFTGPHEPYDTPKEYADRVDPASMPPALGALPEPGPRPQGRLDGRRREGLTAAEVASLRADYAAGITLIDDEVGALLKVVEERGELDRTVVVFTSDHGEMNGDFDLLEKFTFLDPAVRIPFLIRVPGSPAGAVVDDPAELMDLGATLADLAGAALPEASGARSLMPRMRGEVNRHRRAALSEFRHEAMVATPEWTLGVNARGETYLLFDLAQDPHQLRNLAGDPAHAATAERLRTMLVGRLLA